MREVERYSRVVRRMWNDRDFRDLSPIQPCGQGLWVYLLTTPEQHIIPGLFRAWEAGLAQALKWDLEAFRKAFREAFAKGMVKADWDAGLVWLPNGAKHNPPASPNVVKGWSREFRELPECDLRDEAFEHIGSWLSVEMGEAFAAAWYGRKPNAKPSRKPYGKPNAKPSRKALRKPSANQDQEQEQEQEEGGAPLLSGHERPEVRAFEGHWSKTTVDAWQGLTGEQRSRLQRIDKDPERYAARFKAHHKSRGTRSADWSAELDKWLLADEETQQQRKPDDAAITIPKGLDVV